MNKRENEKNNNKKPIKPDVKAKAVKGGAVKGDGDVIAKKKFEFTPKNLAIIITAAILLVVAVVTTVLVTVDMIKDDPNFDYITSDLSKYVYLSKEDYKDYELEINIAKPHDIDPDVALLNLLASKKGDALHEGAMVTSPATVTPGDVVHIWYRGYILNDKGEENALSGMSNFSNKAASELEIGSGSFVPGFELNLVGKNTGDYPKFEKITTGGVKEGLIVYVSYTRLIEGGTLKTDGKTGTCVRIDLSDDDIDEIYGEGFRDQILNATIGEKMSFSVTMDGKKHNYTDTTVDFVTECEVDPLLIECYFPYDYSTATLRNQTAYFEVYFEGVVEYECPELNDEFIKKQVAEKTSPITEEELLEYEGETLVEKYRAYAKKTLDDTYQENYEALVEDAMWDHYLAKAEVKRYPGNKVDEIYREYENDVYYQFDQTGGSIQNQYTQEYETYEDIDSFAIAYLGLTYSENKDWRNVLYTMSQNLVKERLVLYYLVQEEGLMPSEADFQKEYEAVRQEYLDEYILQYLDYENKTREDYNDEEYAKFVEDRKEELFDYYDEDYFVETTHYEIALREFLKWPKVTTLDDKSSLPQDK